MEDFQADILRMDLKWDWKNKFTVLGQQQQSKFMVVVLLFAVGFLLAGLVSQSMIQGRLYYTPINTTDVNVNINTTDVDTTVRVESVDVFIGLFSISHGNTTIATCEDWPGPTSVICSTITVIKALLIWSLGSATIGVVLCLRRALNEDKHIAPKWGKWMNKLTGILTLIGYALWQVLCHEQISKQFQAEFYPNELYTVKRFWRSTGSSYGFILILWIWCLSFTIVRTVFPFLNFEKLLALKKLDPNYFDVHAAVESSI